MSEEQTGVAFESWLRSVCFQAPPEHVRDLAESAWKAGRALLRQLPAPAIAPDTLDFYLAGIEGAIRRDEAVDALRYVQTLRKAAPASLPEEVVMVPRALLGHHLSVARGVVDLCRPRERASHDDPTEHYGDMALRELRETEKELSDLLAASPGVQDQGGDQS